MGQLSNDVDIVTIFAGAHDHAIELAISYQGIKGTHQLSAVALPTGTKGISLRPRLAAVGQRDHPSRPMGFQMRTGRTRHKSESADVGKLQHSHILRS